MTRRISLNFRAALTGRASEAIPVVLLTIDHPLLAEPQRLSTDNTERLSDEPRLYCTRSRGDVYTFAPIDVILPGDSADRAPAAELGVPLVDESLLQALRSTVAPGTCRIELVDAAAPDIVEMSWGVFDIAAASFDTAEARVKLTHEHFENEPWPAGSFYPNWFGGLFQ